MLHSTTSTGSFDIVKYSRSYPPSSIAGSESQASQRTPTPQLDWQHFFNPLMRLVLDITKSERGELESVRLRILWYMDGGPAPANDAMDIDQRDPVIFVSLADTDGAYMRVFLTLYTTLSFMADLRRTWIFCLSLLCHRWAPLCTVPLLERPTAIPSS